MKIDRRAFLVASSSAIALGKNGFSLSPLEASTETPESPELQRIADKEITVYTTADKTDHRITATDKLTF